MQRKNYPPKMQHLLGQVLTSTVVGIPPQMMEVITDYQRYHQKAKGGHKLTVPEISVLLMQQGIYETRRDIQHFQDIIEVRESEIHSSQKNYTNE